MKRKLNIILISVILILFSNTAFASKGSLEFVKNKAIINSDGTVKIEQVWKYDDRNIGDITEHFINLNALYSSDGNIGIDETITDYKVYLNNIPLDFNNDWNIKASFNEKAGQYGVLNTGNGSVELCFGITEYGINEFRVEYTVHNAIKLTRDGKKYLHWTFTPTDLDPQPHSLTATVETGGDFTIDKIYGFNYKGYVRFDDMDKRDKITATMDEGTYGSDTTINIFTLIKDDNNVISNTRPTDRSIEEKVKEIFIDSDYDISHFNEETQEEVRTIGKSGKPISGVWRVYEFFVYGLILLLSGLRKLIYAIIFFIAIYIIILKNTYKTSFLKDIDKEELKKIRKDKEFYRRDEPEEIVDFYPVLDMIIHTPNRRLNLLMYFISKWTSEGVFEYIGEGEEEIGMLFKKKAKEITFKIEGDRLSKDASYLEKSLFTNFSVLASENILSTKDLDKLKISNLEKLFAEHTKVYKTTLKEKGYITGEDKDARLTEKGKEVIYQHIGLKNFLRDFTLINEREAREIKLWDYYFHLAAMYGMTGIFKKQLDMIPNLSQSDRQTYNRYYGNSGTAILSRNVSKTMSSHYRSSGGGGGSSSGGGRGSSGGGSRGGTR